MVNDANESKDESKVIDDSRFWTKVAQFAQRAGRSVLEKALILYYVLKSEHVPKHIKAMIFAALTYFISTIDAIPDIVLGIGFVDDLGVLAAVSGSIAAWVSPQIQSKVDDKLAKFFKTDVDSSVAVEDSSAVVEKSTVDSPFKNK